jgi:hypothetical protein
MRSAFSAESRPVSTRIAPIELLLPIGWALPYAGDSPVLFAWFRLMLGKLVLTGFIIRFLSVFREFRRQALVWMLCGAEVFWKIYAVEEVIRQME